ncbi:MAG: hypothetical protein LCI00_31380 [Chloroflexi bacterium]|nr:hypothetical protein [Chloroflexota bacterium]MCC6893265.1 hypothetical protein [Anaerolineae bacterium]
MQQPQQRQSHYAAMDTRERFAAHGGYRRANRAGKMPIQRIAPSQPPVNSAE